MQIQSDDIATIFDVCLERMRRGESIGACVLDYPSKAEELEPLLITAMYTHHTFRPPSLSPQARQAIQRQLRQAVAARQPAQRRTPVSWFGPLVMRFVLALLIALLSLGGGVAAAQSSLPGSSLYPLKRASESVRLRLASSPTQRAALHLDFAAARSAEMLALASGEQKTISASLVDDLDREYQLAWAEIAQAPADQVSDLVGRYVVERQADVKAFSATMPRANAAAQAQMQRAVRLGEQALATVDPGRRPMPQPAPDSGVNTDSTPGPDAPDSGDNPAIAGPKPTPEGKPANAGPKPTPEGKPADAGPKPTPEGKPADAGPKPTPEGKPANAEPNPTPEGKPADAGPPATPEDKPDSGGSNPKPKPKPGHGKP
jgi:hypothetical protein